MNKTTQIYDIRTIIEAINANEPIDKIFVQRGLKGGLSKELETLVRKNGINVSYVPVEKLNRLTKNNHQGAVANISPISFYSLEELVENVMENNLYIDMTCDEYLSVLVDHEWEQRQQQRMDKLFKQACFKQKASIAEVRFTQQRSLDKNPPAMPTAGKPDGQAFENGTWA